MEICVHSFRMDRFQHFKCKYLTWLRTVLLMVSENDIEFISIIAVNSIKLLSSRHVLAIKNNFFLTVTHKHTLQQTIHLSSIRKQWFLWNGQLALSSVSEKNLPICCNLAPWSICYSDNHIDIFPKWSTDDVRDSLLTANRLDSSSNPTPLLLMPWKKVWVKCILSYFRYLKAYIAEDADDWMSVINDCMRIKSNNMWMLSNIAIFTFQHMFTSILLFYVHLTATKRNGTRATALLLVP